MTKMELIQTLSEIKFIYNEEQDNNDRFTFEFLVTSSSEMGLKCLLSWTSKYFVSFRSKQLIDNYIQIPLWENFREAAQSLMLDRIIAAIALEGNVTSCVKECVDLVLNCGNIDLRTLSWVEYYCGLNVHQMAV